MKRNAKNIKSKLSLVLCLAMTLVLLVGSVFAITASAEEKSATLSFANKAQRTSFSTTKQVWEQNGITLTNDKSSSTSNVADYAAPARFYASSKITVTAPGNITKIVFDCNSNSYATAMKTSIGTTATTSVSSDKVTVTLNSVESFTIAKLSGQIRMDSITVTYVEANAECTHANTSIDEKAATCTEAGYKNTVCDDCGKIITPQNIAALGHNYENGACTRCQKEAPENYYLVTDASTLRAGDKIIIVAKDSAVAMGASKGNNRYQQNVTKNNGVVTFETEVSVFTLEAGTVDGTFAFRLGNMYLYAASSSDNHLKETSTKTDDASWQITIASDGTATVVAKGSNERNTMQYNQSSSLFSCYGSASQKAISIYKAESSMCNHEAKISGAQVSLGENLAIRYYVTLCEHLNASDLAMSFTMNETTVDVTECVKAEDGRYVFTFSGIAPQCMGDNVAATVTSNGEVLATLDTYSVKANLVSLLSKNPSDELKTLIYDTLTYGAKAQVYRNHNTDNLVTKDVAGLTASENVPGVYEAKVEASTSENVSFKSAGVHFSAVNKIYVKFTATTLEGVKLLAGDKELAVEHVSGNVYIAYSDALNATELNNAITFSLTENGEAVQTLTYSVAHYAAAKWNQTEADGETLTAMADLARALYRYGVSAYEYAN